MIGDVPNVGDKFNTKSYGECVVTAYLAMKYWRIDDNSII